MFFDLTGLAEAIPADLGKTLEITLYLKNFERRERLFSLTQAVNADTFKLGCTPIVNLFRQNTEPLIISHLKTDYQVIPDVRRPWGLEIYSIDSVRKLVKTGDRGEVVEYRPFYSLRHGTGGGDEETYWNAARRASPRQDDAGTDVYLSLVDLNFNPALPATDALFISATCLNRDLPGSLPFGGEQGDLQVEGEAPVARIRCLRKPTDTQRPSRRKGTYWRLISHLSLNHLSLVDGGREALLEILSLYNFFDSPALQKQIAGITKVDSAPGMARVGPPQRQAFVRGLDVNLEFDEDMYVGGGIYLLASVLERFLGLYCSINSFTRLTITSQQREKPLAVWKPRSGGAIVV
jgi:type VI secretion system protein ImpG